MLTILLYLAAIVVMIALAITIVVIRRQQKKELDKGMNMTTLKHPIIANPIIIAYVLFPLVVVIGAVILMYYYK